MLGCRLFSLTNNETVSLLFDEKKLDELERQIILMSLMDKMGQLYGLHATVDSNHNKAFLGLSAILQHYVDSDEAKLFWDFYCNACTVKDVWNFFLTENELRPESVKFKNRLR